MVEKKDTIYTERNKRVSPMTFYEFIKIFPDEENCHEYLISKLQILVFFIVPNLF